MRLIYEGNYYKSIGFWIGFVHVGLYLCIHYTLYLKILGIQLVRDKLVAKFLIGLIPLIVFLVIGLYLTNQVMQVLLGDTPGELLILIF